MMIDVTSVVYVTYENSNFKEIAYLIVRCTIKTYRHFYSKKSISLVDDVSNSEYEPQKVFTYQWYLASDIYNTNSMI